MEVIYGNKKDNGEVTLPMNIKQIGKDGGKVKVFIEDYVYTFVNDLRQDEYDEGLTGLLLGEVKKSKEGTYVFVKGAVEVTNAAVFSDKIAFTEETWPIANGVVAQFFGDMEIVGWYLNSTTITDSNMDVINKADKESFKEDDKVFFLVNPESASRDVYIKSKNGLKKADGYAVYFDKNEAMQNYMTDTRRIHIQHRTDSDESVGRYRKLINEKNPVAKSTKRNFAIVYGLSMLLLVLVLIFGINRINSYDKMKENTLVSGEVSTTDKEKPTKEITPVETEPGNVETTEVPTTEAPTTEEPTTEAPTTEAPTTEPPTEKPTEPAYDMYTVQMGDNFIKICRQFYGTESMADVALIRNANNMSETDDLLIGAEIKIPKK